MRRAALITGIAVGVFGLVSTTLVLTLGTNREAAEPSAAAAIRVPGTSSLTQSALRSGANSLKEADRAVKSVDDLVQVSGVPQDDLAKPAQHTAKAKDTADKVRKDIDNKIDEATKGRAKSASEKKTLRDQYEQAACGEAKQALFQELVNQLENGQQEKPESQQEQSEQDLTVTDLAQVTEILCDLA